MSIVKLILLIGFISLSIQETELCAIDVVGEGVCRPIGDCASSQIMQGCSKGFGCCMDDSEIGNLEVDSWARKPSTKRYKPPKSSRPSNNHNNQRNQRPQQEAVRRQQREAARGC